MSRVHFKKAWAGLVVGWFVLAAWASERVIWWLGWALLAFGLFTVGLFIVFLKSPKEAGK